MKRRGFLNLVGGGVVLGATGCALDPETSSATKPWRVAGEFDDDPRIRSLSYAILAPNPHNRQPWLVDLRKSGEITLLADPTRMLPITDPFSRQITIGLGCFLEQLKIAASHQGYALDINTFPQGSNPTQLDGRPVAHIRLIGDASIEPDPLFAHVLDRRSVKEPFDTSRSVPKDALLEMNGISEIGLETATSAEESRVKALRDLTADAIELELRTPPALQESVDLFRIGRAEIEANPDGIDFGGLGFELLGTFGLFTRENATDTDSTGFKQAVEGQRENCNTAMAHIWIVTDGNERTDQLHAGAAWLRTHLIGTKWGLSMHPLSQALQEYKEMADFFRQVHAMLATDGGTVQMLGRIGYGPVVQPSPRWELETRMV